MCVGCGCGREREGEGERERERERERGGGGGREGERESIYRSCQVLFLLTMLEKSAPPTPTMTMERGSLEAPTMRSTVRLMSDMTPSCRYSRYSTESQIHTVHQINMHVHVHM